MSDNLQDRLDEAVSDVLSTLSPGVPTAWMLLAHQANFDEEGESVSSYPIILMNGSLPDHVIMGLLKIASDHVRGVGKWAHSHNHEFIDDDEEDGEEEG